MLRMLFVLHDLAFLQMDGVVANVQQNY